MKDVNEFDKATQMRILECLNYLYSIGLRGDLKEYYKVLAK